MSEPQFPVDESPSPKSRWRRLVRTVLLFVGVPYLAVALLFTLGQRKLIYHPVSTDSLSVESVGLAPAFARDVDLVTDDGLTLHGWLLPGYHRSKQAAVSVDAGPVDAGTTSTNPLVIYFPGNASNRAGRINDLRDFTLLGCDVLIFDYRGYADNPGSPTEESLSADARAIWRYADETLGSEPDKTVLFGESLGGAVAVDLASSLSREGTPPAALITNATFDSLPSLSGYHYPFFPFRWLVWDRWASDDRIAEVTCPILMFHGTADRIVPIEHGRQLFAAAPSCSTNGCEKCFVEIPGAGHNDIPVHQLGEEVMRLFDNTGIREAESAASMGD